MTNQLGDALAQAADAGRASFESRGTAEIVDQTARRIRRHRATVSAVAVVGSVAMVAGSLWAADAVAGRTATLTPAVTAEPPDDSHDIATGNQTVWSTAALAMVVSPRTMDEKRVGSVAGMICRHENPTDDPRVAAARSSDPTISHILAYADCKSVWFKKRPITSDSNASAASTPATASEGATLSAQVLIRNDSDRALMIDRDSIFMWIETAPNEVSASQNTVYAHAILGGSMWQADGENQALLDSSDEPVVIGSGAYFNVSGFAAEGTSAPGPLTALVASGSEYTVTFWARIHEDGADGDATYLVQLGEPHTYGGIDPDAGTVD